MFYGKTTVRTLFLLPLALFLTGCDINISLDKKIGDSQVAPETSPSITISLPSLPSGFQSADINTGVTITQTEQKAPPPLADLDGEAISTKSMTDVDPAQGKSEYTNVPGISNIPKNSIPVDGVPGISDLAPTNNPYDENQPVTSVPGTSSPDQGNPPPPYANSERAAVLNDLRYASEKVREKLGTDDPTLEESLASLKSLMNKFKTVRENGDNSEYLRNLQVIRDAEKSLARVKAKAESGLTAISENGRHQMATIVEYARTHNTGYSGGNCFNAVWGYMTSCGYGNLRKWGDLPNMASGEARNLSEYLNASPAHLDEAGLQRLDTALNPPITNPHDSRIPNGAIIVVSAGSYGTRHATAGDVVVKTGPSHFINDGPAMDYGTSDSWYGKVLGIYVPR